MKSMLFGLLLMLPLSGNLPSDVVVREFPGGVGYVWPMSTEESTWVRMTIPVSLLHEEEPNCATVLPQLMTKGTDRFSEDDIVAFLIELGGLDRLEIRVGDFDQTVFGFCIPHGREDLVARALTILADWAWHWSPRSETVCKRFDKPVLFAPRPSHVAAAAGRLADFQDQALPSMEAVIRFYEKWYRHLPIGLFVAGDVDGDWVHDQIAEAFASLPEGERLPLCYPKIQPQWPEQLTWYLAPAWTPGEEPKDGIVKVSVMMLVEEERAFSCDRDVISDVVSNILAIRFWDRLNEGWGFTQPVLRGCEYAHPCCRHFAWQLECRLSCVAEVVELVARELEGVKAHGVTEEEVQTCGALMNAHENAMRRAAVSRTPKLLAWECGHHFLGAGSKMRADMMLDSISRIGEREVGEYATRLALIDGVWIHLEVLTNGLSKERVEGVVRQVEGVMDLGTGSVRSRQVGP